MKESYIEYKYKLSEEYKNVFERIEAYVYSCKVDENTREERMNELLDMFLTAQNEGRPIEKIVGKDIEKFSQIFCSSFSLKNRLLSEADSLRSCFLYGFITSAFQMLLWFLDLFKDRSEHNIMNRYMDLDVRFLIIDFAIMALFMSVTDMVFRKAMFKTKRFSMKIYKAVRTAVLVLGLVALIAAEVIVVLDNDIELVDTPAVIVFAVSGAYLLAYYLLRGRKNKKNGVIENE